jgi:hypothetical protein
MAENDKAPFLGGFDVLADTLHGKPGDTTDEGRIDAPMTGGSDDGGTGDDNLIDDKRTIKDTPGVKTVEPDFFAGKTTDDGDDDDDDQDGADDATDDDVDTDGDDDGNDGDDDSAGADDSIDDGDDFKSDPDFEVNVTSFIKDQLSNSLGWDFSEMEEEPKSIEDIVEFMKDLVAENSVPTYANDEVKEYDEFVRNGGDLRDFFKETIQGRINPDEIDITDETDQKRVIRQNLRNQGISEKIIEKRLTRYDEAGVLEEEAEEALDLVKEYDEVQRKKLLETQQKQAQDIEKQQQKFVDDVEKNIKSLSEIKGLNITEKDKKELRDYILVADADGMTQYQKDYMSDINNLLESAYFTKNKDVLLDRAKRQGSSNSLRDLQKKLNNNKGNRSKNSGSKGTNKSSLGIGDLGNRLGL